MPLQNRVTPFGELVADPARGLVYGNRGCLHDADGHIRRGWATRRWIACRLRFRGWQRHPLLQPGKFTELFFLDDATALAAGHRPCALCRRADYVRLCELWQRLHRPSAAPMRSTSSCTASGWMAAAGGCIAHPCRRCRTALSWWPATSPSWWRAMRCGRGRRPATARRHGVRVARHGC